LLSLGDDVDVLQPEWFRQEVKQVVDGLKENYDK